MQPTTTSDDEKKIKKDRERQRNTINAYRYARDNEFGKLRKIIELKNVDLNYVPCMVHLTPLMQAAIRGHIESLNLLIDAGAKLDYRIKEGQYTALAQAIVHQKLDCVDALLKAGASMDAFAGNNSTVLDLAKEMLKEAEYPINHEKIAKCIKCIIDELERRKKLSTDITSGSKVPSKQSATGSILFSQNTDLSQKNILDAPIQQTNSFCYFM